MGEFLQEEGRYNAKPIEWGFNKTKAGSLQVFIRFEGQNINMCWYGSLNEGKAREITLTSLLNCGFRYPSLELFERFDALDKTREVSIVVTHRDNLKGQPRAKIAWVNKIGSNKVDSKESKEMLRGLDLKGDLLMVMQENGVKPKAPPVEESDPSVDEVPF